MYVVGTSVVKKPKTRPPASLQTAAPLLTRAAVFLAVFIIYSGLLGTRIISHGLVSHDGFQVYGGAGKALLFGVLALVLLIKRKGFTSLKPWHPKQVVWLLLSILAITGAWLSLSRLISTHNTTWAALVHLCLWASVIFAAGAVFGPANLRRLAKKYKQELLISLGLAVAFFGFLYLVYGLWKWLAAIVLHSVQWLMNRIGIHSVYQAPRTLVFNKFAIDVAQFCSGIESIALFTALYALVGILDWPSFNHRRYLALFFPGLIILFLFNILRVFLLILGGYYINPHIAFSLFHTYAGMLFFILYSIIFWAVSYRWLLKD